MKKEIIFDEELRKKWLSGAKKIAKAVGSTLGPCGRFFATTGYKTPVITKDGVSVAKDIDLPDPVENLGAALVREMSLKTNETAGDGTTTTVVLGFEMLKEGYKAVEAGCRPIEIKRGMDKATNFVLQEFEKNTRELTTQEEVEKVATISANNDEELGKVIAKGFEIAGKDGVVHAETTRGTEIEIEESNGFTFDSGWLSSYFVNNKDKMEVNFEDALVLLTDKKISLGEEIIPFLEESATQKKPLFIVCDELQGEALNVIVLNLLSGNVQVAAAKCPGYASSKLDWLNDISTITGATLITDATGAELKDCGPEFLGETKIVKATKTETTIIGGKGDQKIIDEYVKTLKNQKDVLKSPRDKDNMEKRIARFTGSAVTIKIGASTETEAKEIKDRADDAICAVRAALESGITEGAGINYARFGRALIIDDENYPTEDMKRGAKIIKEALKAPLKQIAENAGENGDVIYGNCFKDEKGLAYNAKTNEYGDAYEMGIIEPIKVQKEALKNANSIAGVMLATSGANVVVEDDKEELAN